MLARLDRAVGGEEIGPPGAEVGLLGDAARRAQAVEHGVLVGLRIEEGGVEAEEPAIGGVVGAEPPVGAEDGDGGRELVEGAGVEVDLAAERGLGLLDRGHVDGDAGAAARRGDVERRRRCGARRRRSPAGA